VRDLSDRKREIIDELERGKSYKEIAAELCLSESTIRTHVHKAFHFYGVDHRGALLRAHRRSKVPWAAVMLHEQHGLLSEERWREVCIKVLDALEDA